MRITRPVGDIFVYKVPDSPMDVWLKVVMSEQVDTCTGCAFDSVSPTICHAMDFEILGHCSALNRTDGNDVIFKQIGTYKPQKGEKYGD